MRIQKNTLLIRALSLLQVFLFVSVLVPCEAASQETPAALIVEVRDNHSRLVPGALIRIRTVRVTTDMLRFSHRSFTGETNANGVRRFDNFDLTGQSINQKAVIGRRTKRVEVTIEVEVPGFYLAQESTHLTHSQPTARVQVRLERIKPTASGPTERVQPGERQPQVSVKVIDGNTGQPVHYVNIGFAKPIRYPSEISCDPDKVFYEDYESLPHGQLTTRLQMQVFRESRPLCIRVWREGCERKVFQRELSPWESNSYVFTIICVPTVRIAPTPGVDPNKNDKDASSYDWEREEYQWE